MDDQAMKPGMQWRPELRRALGSARSFVAVLSLSYFNSEYCGKEWNAFANRLTPHQGLAGADLLVQPALRVGTSDLDPMPTVVSARQYDYAEYPEDYSRQGFAYLQELETERDKYRQFLDRLSGLLANGIRATKSLIPSDDVPDLSGVSSAFHDPMTRAPKVDRASAPGSHLSAQFVYVAALSSELDGVRVERIAYGEASGMQWQPFQPPDDEEITLIAQAVTAREKFLYEPVKPAAGLADRLAEASQANKVVVVIVDPWSVQLESYRELMAELDQRSMPNCAVIVPFNKDDSETTTNVEQLRAAVHATFENRHTVDDPESFIVGVASRQDLEQQLAKALAVAKIRVLKRYAIRQEAGLRSNQTAGPPVISAVSP
jgi:FxsC-like protein